MEYKHFEFVGSVYSDYEYGETVYVVEPQNQKWRSSTVYLHEMCPVCDDTKKIIVRGYEFDCPHCYNAHGKATNVSLIKWVITPFIINTFEVVGDARKGAYVPSAMYERKNCPTVRSWGGFNKTKNDIRTMDFCVDITEELDVEKINKAENFGKKVFRDKKLAEAVCRKLHDLQKEKLIRFNKEHGTNHEYPFDVEMCVKG